MKLHTIFLISIMGLVEVKADDFIEDLAREFSYLPIKEKKIENLPKGHETEVIAELVRRDYYPTLLRINHAPTIESVAKDYLEKEGCMNMMFRESLARSCSPYLIEKIAPALYKEDRPKPGLWRGEFPHQGQSAETTVLICKLLIDSPEFSPEVKEWAKLRHHGSIFQARQFIELNQEALKAHQFDEVIVPPSPPLYPALITAEEAAERAKKSDKKPHTDLAVPAEEITPKQPRTTSKYWWLVGLSLAVVLTYFILKKKV